MSKNFLIILVIIVVVLLTASIYLLFLTGQLTKQNSTPSPTSIVQSPASEQSTPTPIQNLALTRKAIEENINNKNYQGLIPYMLTPKIDFSLMSSECCEPMTPQETINQLSYINKGIPLDFNQETDLVKNLKNKNSQLAGTLIGISKTGEQLAAFTIDSENKISVIQLAVTYKLYNQ